MLDYLYPKYKGIQLKNYILLRIAGFYQQAFLLLFYTMHFHKSMLTFCQITENYKGKKKFLLKFAFTYGEKRITRSWMWIRQ